MRLLAYGRVRCRQSDASSLELAVRGWLLDKLRRSSRDDARRPVVWIRQCLLQAFGGFAIARFRKAEIHGLAVAVHCPEQVQPMSGDPIEGFIDLPGGRFWFHLSAQPPVYFRPAPLNPTRDGGMIYGQARSARPASGSFEFPNFRNLRECPSKLIIVGKGSLGRAVTELPFRLGGQPATLVAQ